mgnify:CR=1 FL=1
MKDFRNLVEAKETIVFTFGRFNPPTIGHEKLIKKVSQVAGSNPYQIYPSFTTNPKKDPLPHALKVAYMRKMFKKYAKNIIADISSKTAINIAVKLYDEGYKNLVMVAGSDRIKEFDTLLGTYNGVEGKRHGYYKFDSIKVVSAGERDPDAEGVEGMSASKMRAAAVDGDYDSFSTGIPATLSDADKKKLYRDVRKYMGIREERDMGDMSDFETLRDAYLVGQIWNVGDIVEANDIRGEVIRKGANYLSYVDENNKVHKAWLHDIILEDITKRDLDQIEKYADKLFGAVGIDVEFTRHFMDRVNDARNKTPITTSELVRLFKQSFKKYGKKIAKLGPDAEAVIKDMKTDINMPFVLDLKGGELELIAKTVMRKKDFKTSGPKLAFEELSERNYRKEYDNYQGTPEQIARRSSRNKARRVMGDKTKIGMDVGHKDNDPMNNDPKNLRNEDPSKNRREPRLREKEEIDELSSSIGWLNTAAAKISQITHPKGWDKIMKTYIDGMKDDEHRKNPSKWAVEVAKRYRGVDARSLVKYINILVSKGKIPKELKTGYQMEKNTFSDLMKSIDEVKQDKEIKDKEGTQPAKYYSDMAKSTKDKRATHFKKKKEGPAPGDASAETKPSKFTKKFKQMFGEAREKYDSDKFFGGKGTPEQRTQLLKLQNKALKAFPSSPKQKEIRKEIDALRKKMGMKVKTEKLGKDADQGDYIDDFQKSDAPQFKGKSKEKRKEMAIAAYLSKNESTIVEGLSMIIKDPKTKKKMQLAANQKVQWNGSNYETDGVTKKQVLVMRDGRKEVVMTKQQIEDNLKNGSFKVTDLGNVYQPEELQIESFQLNEKIEGLVTKAEKSGMPYGILKKVYDRGMAAYKTGHRPGTTAQQWAFARVNSFVTKSSGTWGKADADLAKQVRGESVKEETPCWNGFKQVGMKTKGGKQVPNCVPEETTTEACCDDCDDLYDHVIAEAEYQGKKVQLNNPIRTSENPNKKFKVYTMGPSGKVVVVRFGDPKMGINRDDPKARAAFRSRHSCDEKKDKTTAGYWSCYQWRASSKVDN